MFTLLVILVVVLGIVAAAQLSKVYQLSLNLRNKREEDISLADNKMNAVLMIVFMLGFYISFIWLMVKYGDFLPDSASAHGEKVDWLLNVNWVIIITVFFVVNTLLFYFSFKYYYRADRKALFFPHDNKLEMIWTIVPTIVLAGIIIFGLITWLDITEEADDTALEIELFAYQFGWQARYAGADQAHGEVNFNLMGGTNRLGIVTEAAIKDKLVDLDEGIAATIDRMVAQKQRILDMEETQVNAREDDGKPTVQGWTAGNDDKVVIGEFHVVKGRQVAFDFSRVYQHNSSSHQSSLQKRCVKNWMIQISTTSFSATKYVVQVTTT